MIVPRQAIVRASYLWIVLAVAAVLGGHEAIAQTAIPPAAQDFALSAAQSDQYEILAGRDALAQSQNSSIRAFAQQMIEDHTRTSETLRQAVSAAGLSQPPSGMSGDQTMMLSALQSLRGAEFDQAYARQQVLAHRQALAVADSYAKSGADANLRKTAQSAVPLIQHHLEQAEQLRAALGGS
jgi:putative membrane protein